jgi:hypothetical protein
MVVRTLLHNAEVAKAAVVNAVALLADASPSPYANALEYAMITNRQMVPRSVVDKLYYLRGRYF